VSLSVSVFLSVCVCLSLCVYLSVCVTLLVCVCLSHSVCVSLSVCVNFCVNTHTHTHSGKVSLYKGLECPLCSFELLLFTVGERNKKSVPLCPFCYNHPPKNMSIENLDRGLISIACVYSCAVCALCVSVSLFIYLCMICIHTAMDCARCFHPSCRHSATRNQLRPHQCTPTSFLVLDPNSGPKCVCVFVLCVHA